MQTPTYAAYCGFSIRKYRTEGPLVHRKARVLGLLKHAQAFVVNMRVKAWAKDVLHCCLPPAQHAAPSRRISELGAVHCEPSARAELMRRESW